jgi:hypothetical protein
MKMSAFFTFEQVEPTANKPHKSHRNRKPQKIAGLLPAPKTATA